MSADRKLESASYARLVRVETSAKTVQEVLSKERASNRRVGFVPTMGALHAGHASLLDRARSECDVVVLSIFVNPRQFGDPNDLASYPRPIERDLDVAERALVDVAFTPSVSEMYPNGFTTRVRVEEMSDILEGRSRPGHFDGVATVAAKLLSVVGECRSYFGEKDWQQLMIVRRMVSDLCLPVDVIGCPTVREPDGLALSSRNVRLSDAGRVVATCLSRSLYAGSAAIADGVRDASVVKNAMLQVLSDVSVDYAEIVDEQLRVSEVLHGEVRLLVAADVENVRLIDNVGAVA